MTSVVMFRKFMGLSVPSVRGTRATGLLEATKIASKQNQAFEIPAGHIFTGGGYNFKTTERFEIPESRTDPFPFAVQAVTTGSAQNLAAGQTFRSAGLFGLTFRNILAFEGGTDDTPEVPGLFPDQRAVPDDDILEFHLNGAKLFCRSLMGLKAGDEYPTDANTDTATYLVAMYRFQQRSTQESRRPVPQSQAESPMETSYYRANLWPALIGQVAELLGPHMDFNQLIVRKEDD